MAVDGPRGCTDGRAGEGLAEGGAGASEERHGQSMRMRCVGIVCDDSEHDEGGPRRLLLDTRVSLRAHPTISGTLASQFEPCLFTSYRACITIML